LSTKIIVSSCKQTYIGFQQKNQQQQQHVMSAANKFINRYDNGLSKKSSAFAKPLSTAIFDGDCGILSEDKWSNLVVSFVVHVDMG
jgi:hypothetical protein